MKFRSSKQVLILGSAADPHVEAVNSQLIDHGGHPHIFSYREMLQGDNALSAHYQNGKFQAGLSINGKTIELYELDSVWLRRPGHPVAARLAETWLEWFSSYETKRALDGLFNGLNCKFVNSLARQEECLHKTYQLRMAQNSGLQLPRTLLTNDASKVEQFYKDCDRQVIYKLIDERSWQYFPKHRGRRGIPTLPLRDQDLPYLEQVGLSLHLFQERIDKVCDLRATIVGQQIFVAKITGKNEDACLDWRFEPKKVSSFELPVQIKEKCFELMAQLGLSFAALDLCLDKDGNYFFLEANPAGQFLWLEDELKMPISQAIAKVLLAPI